MQTQIRFAENRPLNTEKLAELLSDRADLSLVWPYASWPFDHDQWRKVLAPREGHRSYFICAGSLLIGHAALRKIGTSGAYDVCFLYLAPSHRGQGLGGRAISFLEQMANDELNASSLRLGVRSYNPRAIKCYVKAGFTQCSSEGTLIWMTKDLHNEPHAGDA